MSELMRKKNDNSEGCDESELEMNEDNKQGEDGDLAFLYHGGDDTSRHDEKLLGDDNESVDGACSAIARSQEMKRGNNEKIRSEEAPGKTKMKRKYTKSHLRTRYSELQQEGKGFPQSSSSVVNQNLLIMSSASTHMPLDILPNTIASAHCDDVTLKFLSAQTKVLKEELQSVILECMEKDDLVTSLEKQLKLEICEKNKALKENTSKDAVIAKYQRSSDEHKFRAEEIEGLYAELKNEVGSLKQGKKQVSTSKHSAETKLHQTVQEIEKYKKELHQLKQSANETSENNKKKMEKLLVENKIFAKQKLELMSAFKKQQKLIENLKRQKIHLEATKILEFTEQEFTNALD